MKLEEKLLELCQQQQLTLALAESCTGGSVAARLTQIPGASKCFAGSLVSYQDLVKRAVLLVPETVLATYGAVSQETTTAMLNGALSLFSADVAAAVTGIAGPTGSTNQTPLGTVFIALGGKGFQPESWKLQLQGTRSQIIHDAAEQVLVKLLEFVTKNGDTKRSL